MNTSRILFKKVKSGTHRVSGTRTRRGEGIDDVVYRNSLLREDNFPGNPIKNHDHVMWIHAEHVKKGSTELREMEYRSSFLKLLTASKNNLDVGVHRCLLSYKNKQTDHIRSLISVWPLQEQRLIEVLLEDNEIIPGDVEELKLMPIDLISDRTWHSMPGTHNQRKLKQDEEVYTEYNLISGWNGKYLPSKKNRNISEIPIERVETVSTPKVLVERKVRASMLVRSAPLLSPVDLQEKIEAQLNLLKKLNIDVNRKRK